VKEEKSEEKIEKILPSKKRQCERKTYKKNLFSLYCFHNIVSIELD